MDATKTYSKPLPIPDQDSRPYWEGTKQHKLLLQRCHDCGRAQFYPRLLCANCLSDNVEWFQASGKGTIYTFTVNYRAANVGFKDEVPYVVALIDLDEGPRMMTNVVGCKPEDVRIGLPVNVIFEDVSPEITLPKFKLADRSRTAGTPP